MNQEQVETKLTPAQIENELAQCTGGDEYHRHPISGLLYTDGVRTMAEVCGAYWLIDIVASYQYKFTEAPSLSEFQVWELKVKGNRGVVTCQSDSDCPPVVRQVIRYTDFPLNNMKLWVEGGVIILPSEH
jgi:hypothetical protein